MNKTETRLFLELLAEIPDYRVGNAVRHKLDEMLSIVILAILCNANTLTGIERFGLAHERELREFLELPGGIPSHDTFGDVLSHLDYEAVGAIFTNWLTSMGGQTRAETIAIDGKTVRRSSDGLRKATHIVTAYSADLQLVLGQVLTDEKSNEITAIPQLLDMLDIQGSTITIDAIGTQTAIAEKIVRKGGHYILALKQNQASLFEDAQLCFETEYLPIPAKELQRKGLYASTCEKGHGRVEKRECWVMQGDLSQLRYWESWQGASGIAVIRSTRSSSDGETSTSYRYFLFSHTQMTADAFLKLQRQHWAIENSLHWVLDVNFREDSLHARVEHIAIVMNLLRKLVLQLLKHDKTLSGSMAGKREICAWRFDLALKLLQCAANP